MNEMRKVLFVTALLIFALIFGSGTNHAQVSARLGTFKEFQVGVLRSDGSLVPFVEYRHGLWWNPWPQPAQIIYNNEVIPKSLSNHPEPWFQKCNESASPWYFWSSIGTRTVLNAQKLTQVDGHGDRIWAVMTDYPAKRKDEIGAHHTNIGFALNIDLKLEAMIDIEKESAEAKGIVAHIKSAFINLESADVARIAAEPATSLSLLARGFPFSKDERAKIALNLVKLTRSKTVIDGRRLYYFIVEKQYSRPESQRDWQCYNVAELSGWILKGKDGNLSIVNEYFWITDCDRKGGGAVTSSSIFRLKDRTFVFTAEHDYDSESYLISELTEYGLDPLLETHGG